MIERRVTMRLPGDDPTAESDRSFMVEINYGAIADFFVVTAIRHYIHEILPSDPGALRALLATIGQWSTVANWIGVAKDIREKLEANQYRQ